MGRTRYDSGTWTSHSTMRGYASASSVDTILTSTVVDKTMSAANIPFREARDSVANPNSLPVILALDTTGSMGSVILECIKKYHLILEELVDKKAIPDPAVMTMFFDDVHYESGERSLQISQFESDHVAMQQLDKMVVTSAGGGNNSESYHLPLYMAAFKTRTDAFEKRGQRGFLFTVGDEAMPPPLTPEQVKKVFGNDESVTEPLSYMDLFHAASRMYHVFHVVVMQGSFASSAGSDKMRDHWKQLGQNLILVDNIKDLPEVIISTIRIVQGEDAADVAASWSGTTAVTVRNATSHLAKGTGKTPDADVGAVKL